MNKRHAFEEITLSHAGNSVRLRPSLRAVTILEDKFGLAAIDKGLAELDFTIVSEIIRAASSPASDTAAFLLSEAAGRPLAPFFEATIAPLSDLLRMFVPAPVDRSNKAQPTTGQRMAFAELFAALYEIATGFLEWSPEQAWSATPTEINRAYHAHLAKLKAMQGSVEEEESSVNTRDPEQAKRNVAAGLDPEFDRERLRALKMKIASGS